MKKVKKILGGIVRVVIGLLFVVLAVGIIAFLFVISVLIEVFSYIDFNNLDIRGDWDEN